MKILHFIHDLGIGGTQKTCEQFAIELARRGHTCSVVFYEGGATDRCENLDSCAANDVGYDRLVWFGINRENKEKAFQEIVDKFKPDIIHTYLSGYPEFPDPGKDYDPRGAKCVQTNVFGHYNSNPDLHKVLYMSEYLYFHARKHGYATGPDFRYDFIYNPVPKPVVSRVSKLVLDGDKEIWPKDNKIVIGRTGRPENGIYDSISIDALNILLQNQPELRGKINFLVLAPPPNMVKDLKRYSIPFSMHCPTVIPYEIDRIYSKMDIFAHARLDGETCGCVIEEAMMHGLPVVTHVSQPDVPNVYPFQAQTTLVENDRTGFVVGHSAEEYAEALGELIEDADLRKKLGDAGKEVALSLFETGVCVDKLEKIYYELINE